MARRGQRAGRLARRHRPVCRAGPGRVGQVQKAQERANRDLSKATEAVSQLGPRLGAARETSRQAADDADKQLGRMTGTGQRFNRSVALPGLAAAATDKRLGLIVQPDQLDQVTAAANTVLATVAAVRQVPSVNSVLNAFRDFDREVSGQLDVRYRLDDDVLVVEVAGAGDERTLAGAGRVRGTRKPCSGRDRQKRTRPRAPRRRSTSLGGRPLGKGPSSPNMNTEPRQAAHPTLMPWTPFALRPWPRKRREAGPAGPLAEDQHVMLGERLY